MIYSFSITLILLWINIGCYTYMKHPGVHIFENLLEKPESQLASWF